MTVVLGTGEVLVSLEPRADAAQRARRVLTQAGLTDDIAHTVGLLVTELISNALRHAPTGPGQKLVLFARLDDDFARVELADPGRGFDTRTVARGMGLRMVEALASRWGTERAERGFRVWFEVDRRPARRRFAR